LFKFCRKVAIGDQQRDPADPSLSVLPREKRLVEFFERTKPRHRRFAGGGFAAKSSSSVSESISGHSMVGKAMDSSTCWEACANALMSKLSKEPIWERDRFKSFVLIMAFFSLITAVSLRLLRILSRASLAGDKLFVMSKLDMLRNDGLFFCREKYLWGDVTGNLMDPSIDFSIIHQQPLSISGPTVVCRKKKKRKERNNLLLDGIWSSLKLKLFCEQQTSVATRISEFYKLTFSNNSCVGSDD
jgi:hypothetical protein